MDSIKMLIIIIIVCIIIISSALLLILSNNKTNDIPTDEVDSEFEKTILYTPTQTLEKVSNKNKYFAVKNIINLYISNIQEINQEGTDNNKKYKLLYDMLDIEYKNDMNITDYSDIKVSTKYSNYDLKIEEMYTYDASVSIDIFIVYCKLGSQDFKIIVKTDSENNTFGLFLDDYMEKYNYNSQMSEQDIKISINSIEKNENNSFKYINIYDKSVAEEYFYNYVHDTKYDIEKAYDSLDDEYSKIKFGSIGNYKKYIQNNKNIINNLEFSSYSVNKDENIVEYLCKDQYGSSYIFRETQFNEYVVMLDEYTLDTINFNAKYEEATDRDKGILNIDKFFKMINRQDYTNAYTVLDETFKANNFKTLDEFEKYIKSNIFLSNKVNYEQYRSNIPGVHIYKIILTDSTQQDKKEVTMNIVMKLLEGTDFVMSFEIE